VSLDCLKHEVEWPLQPWLQLPHWCGTSKVSMIDDVCTYHVTPRMSNSVCSADNSPRPPTPGCMYAKVTRLPLSQQLVMASLSQPWTTHQLRQSAYGTSMPGCQPQAQRIHLALALLLHVQGVDDKHSISPCLPQMPSTMLTTNIPYVCAGSSISDGDQTCLLSNAATAVGSFAHTTLWRSHK
jgi:hypothetical protein